MWRLWMHPAASVGISSISVAWINTKSWQSEATRWGKHVQTRTNGDQIDWDESFCILFVHYKHNSTPFNRSFRGWISDIPGSSKKTAMRQPSRQRIFPTPHPPDSMLLHSFAWHSLQKKQPFPFGCRHGPVNNIDCGGAGASRVMWQHIRGWLFFWRTRYVIMACCRS